MDNRQFFLIFLMLIVIALIMISINSRVNQLEFLTSVQNRPHQFQNNIYHQSYETKIQIEKVEGNGNAFGDNNKIENKIA